MGLATAKEMQTDGTAEQAVTADAPVGKKISLNFKKKADASIKEIAAATVGSDSATELKKHLLREMSRMDKENMQYHAVMQHASLCFETVCDELEGINRAVDDLERSKPSSWLNWLLGKPVVTQAKIDRVSAMLPDCEKYGRQLQEKSFKMGEKLREMLAQNEVIYTQAAQLRGDDGWKIQQNMSQLRGKCEGNAANIGNITNGFNSLAKQCLELHGKGALTVQRQQAVLQVNP